MRALALGLGLMAALASPLHAHEQTVIRLLLRRTVGPLQIERAGQVRSFERAGAGLRVDGAPVVSNWRGAASGPWRLSSLWWPGSIEVRPEGQAELLVIGALPLEEYVVGALQGEIPALWPSEALRAQAVVSRTYALHERRAHRSQPYDLEAGTMGQVYVGGRDAAPASLRQAARDTRGQVLVWNGEPILAAFHSSAGGRTASAGEVWGRDLRYLVGREVRGEDDSPDTYWRAALTRTTLGRALASAGHDIGEVRSVEVRKRGQSGRVSQVRLRGERGEWNASGRALRMVVGESTLRSTLFDVRQNSRGFTFVGSGSGHGVGMSQWGARALALEGRDYRQILATFYPGAELVDLRDEPRSSRAGAEPSGRALRGPRSDGSGGLRARSGR